MKQNFKHNSPARKTALGGIITLLNIGCLYLASVLPTNRIFFFWLSTIFIAAVVIEIGTFQAFWSFTATSVLSFLIVPNKLVLIPYIVYFGYYGIIKYYIEKINNLFSEWIIKIILFNAAVYISYIVTNSFLFADIKINISLWIVAPLLQVGFVVYDYFYSVMIRYYKYRLRNFIK
jgi:hypothetical protein